MAASRGARRWPGEFILTAVARKNLEAAVLIVTRALREGQTQKEWLTGNIPSSRIR